MKVELKEHIGKTPRGREVKFAQYRVFVEGKSSGLIGFASGSRLCLTTRFGPRERKQIEEAVANLLESDPVQSRQPANVPPEMMQPREEDELDADDLDA